MIHKKVIGKCHPRFDKLLPSKGYTTEDRHLKQIYGHWLEIKEHRALFNRSIFGMVDIYNNLSQAIVDSSSVSLFQSRLTEVARERCKRNAAEWHLSFCRRGGPDGVVQMLMDMQTMKKRICQYWISSLFSCMFEIRLHVLAWLASCTYC